MPKVNFISASQVKPLLVNGKINPPFGRGAITYARELARQMAGIDSDDFASADIERGNELEQEAIDFFERTFFMEGVSPEFTVHPEIKFFGGTADRVYNDFGIDIKCPNQKNHHDNLAEGIQLSNYEHQFQSYMSIYDKPRWALASYNRNFSDNTKMAVEWMERDQEYIDKLLDRVEKFYPVVLDEYKKLNKYKPKL